MSKYNYANVPSNKIVHVGRYAYIEASLHFNSNDIALDKRKHKRIYSDADIAALCDPDNAHIHARQWSKS